MSFSEARSRRIAARCFEGRMVELGKVFSARQQEKIKLDTDCKSAPEKNDFLPYRHGFTPAANRGRQLGRQASFSPPPKQNPS